MGNTKIKNQEKQCRGGKDDKKGWEKRIGGKDARKEL
jgi:hypothetical protein